MKQLEQRLGYTFRDKNLLTTALTHSSYANERPGMQSYERLEFLGDAVLGLCAAKNIWRLYPEMPEGAMTRLRSELVCESSLYTVASRLGLREYVRLGRNEECNGGRDRVSILADIVEAIIAAMYLDGGSEPAEHFIEQQVLCDILAGRPPHRTDYKTQLQELLQGKNGSVPVYTIIGESGPDHNKTFTAQAALPGGLSATGTGKSKKEAEQLAAQKALELLAK